jgi:hypothetical protein
LREVAARTPSLLPRRRLAPRQRRPRAFLGQSNFDVGDELKVLGNELLQDGTDTQVEVWDERTA